MINTVLKEREGELLLLDVDVARLRKIKKPFGKITYTEAAGLHTEYGDTWGDDVKSNEK